MEIGITATRMGLHPSQQRVLRGMLRELVVDRLHHGDCVGGDAASHRIAHELNIPVTVHPPTNPQARSYCEIGPYDILLPRKPYIERNHDIVLATQLLIALPDGPEHKNKRSGTWATYRFARTQGRKAVVVDELGGIFYDGFYTNDEKILVARLGV